MLFQIFPQLWMAKQLKLQIMANSLDTFFRNKQWEAYLVIFRIVAPQNSFKLLSWFIERILCFFICFSIYKTVTKILRTEESFSFFKPFINSFRPNLSNNFVFYVFLFTNFIVKKFKVLEIFKVRKLLNICGFLNHIF